MNRTALLTLCAFLRGAEDYAAEMHRADGR